MLQFYTGSPAHKLAVLLSVAGEFPMSSLHLLGHEKTVQNYIYRAQSKHEIRSDSTTHTSQFLKLYGEGNSRRFRLHKSAIPILRWIDGEEYYSNTFWHGHLPSDRVHLDRRFRVAEAVAVCMNAGIEFRPYRLPVLQNEKTISVSHTHAAFYPAKDIKSIGGKTELPKFQGSRLIGMLSIPDEVFTVYNCRGTVMKWNGSNEFKTKNRMEEIARLNYGVKKADSAILFGNSFEVALENIDSMKNFKALDLRFDSVYRNIHFIPLDSFGAKQIQLITIPNHKERILSILFPNEYRLKGFGSFEYDALIDGKYILSFLDGDIARLNRYREGITCHGLEAEVVCFPEQIELVQKHLGLGVGIKALEIDVVLDALEIDRRNIFEKE